LFRDLIQQYYRFNAWANTRILNNAALLNPEQYLAETNPSFGSVHNTLVHIMSVQWVWLNRWRGVSLSGFYDPLSFPDLASLRTRWDVIEEETQSFTLALSDETLNDPVTYISFQGKEWTYPLWQMMLHQVNHATQHRSETAFIFTGFNHSPGAMDFLYFVDLEANQFKA
jgi:uncharacterized damage-inducible protein DinB